MPRRNKTVALRHMLDHAREALELARGRTRADLDRDRTLNLALTRLLEIVGEAAARVPAETCARYPEIPWREVLGIRNRLTHGYDEVDTDILWNIITRDLQPLIGSLMRITGDLRP